MTGLTRRAMTAGLASGLAMAGCTTGPDSASTASAGGSAANRTDRLPSLYFLHQSKVLVMQPPVMTPRVLNETKGEPRTGVNDGIAIDHGRGHIYWTNMGRASERDGYIMRCDLDGGNITTIVPPGGTHTPKQLKLDERAGRLYWSDREGMAVMRCRTDGTNIEYLVRTGDPAIHAGQQARWCVGMAIDPASQMIYWTQKGGDNAGEGVIRRCPMTLRARQSPSTRTDIQTLFARLPEPIDLDLDLERRHIYWTDRGDNTVSRAPMEPPPDYDPRPRSDREILVRGLNEAIGIALDLPRGRMAYTSLGGEVGVANLDGSDARMLATGLGLLTGAAWG